MKNIAVFASHGGSNLQAVIDGCKAGRINARVSVVISNNSSAFALERAKAEGIPFYHISRMTCQDLDNETLSILAAHKADIIFLAGYLKKISPVVIRAYENKIFNIHPSLLPKYGGKGMHGLNVHRAVLNAGEAETGVTIHRVCHAYDEGEIIAQKRVPILDGDTPETLAARVLEEEHKLITETLARLVEA